MENQPENDRIKKFVAYFKSIFEHDLNMSSFSDRIRLQKLVYILSKAGLDLGYSFSWYLRGSYSSPLASDGYFYRDNKDKFDWSYKFEENEVNVIEKVSRISEFLKDENNSELLASILYLYYELDYKESQLITELKTRKPRFSDEEIKEALRAWGKVLGLVS
ncbi:MAG: hypothetical protein NT022_13120 [Deltaproteobacteria bacterium]|nr:hypothetical protein [Deltaproteobacteria bacterium]